VVADALATHIHRRIQQIVADGGGKSAGTSSSANHCSQYRDPAHAWQRARELQWYIPLKAVLCRPNNSDAEAR
jgi:hypothetical protein